MHQYSLGPTMKTDEDGLKVCFDVLERLMREIDELEKAIAKHEDAKPKNPWQYVVRLWNGLIRCVHRL